MKPIFMVAVGGLAAYGTAGLAAGPMGLETGGEVIGQIFSSITPG